MRVVLAGGGTGGHLYPGIAIAEKLERKKVDIIFMVSDRTVDSKILSPLHYPFIVQHVTPVKGKGFLYKIKSFSKLSVQVLKNMKIIKRSDKVLLLGGFASAAAGLAALLKRCEIYVHEQNSVMGFANRFFVKFAKKVFVSFEIKNMEIPEAVLTGNPVREGIAEIEPKYEHSRHLLVLGGSQGSRFINRLMIESFEWLKKEGIEIKHQTGSMLYNETVDGYKSKYGVCEGENLEITDYVNDIQDALKWSDAVVSRAGSGSVYEIMYAKRPAVFIPLKLAADNHQYFNAKFFEEHGYGYVLTEDEATPANFCKKIMSLFENYNGFSRKLASVKRLNASEIILSEMGFV